MIARCITHILVVSNPIIEKDFNKKKLNFGYTETTIFQIDISRTDVLVSAYIDGQTESARHADNLYTIYIKGI